MRAIYDGFLGRCSRRAGQTVFAVALVAAVSAATASAARADDSQFIGLSDAAMAKMMTAMQIQQSGDTDADFVAMMVPHHQGAIDMARAELLYGHNEILRRMAQEIIMTQQQEIAAMKLAIGQSASPQTEVPPITDHSPMHQEPECD